MSSVTLQLDFSKVPRRSVGLVKFDEDGNPYVPDEGRALLRRLTGGQHLYVCAVQGIGRMGKSYLLNGVLRKDGVFQEQGTMEPVTIGVDMAAVPLKNGSGWVLFLDTEGSDNANKPRNALVDVVGLVSSQLVSVCGAFSQAALCTVAETVTAAATVAELELSPTTAPAFHLVVNMNKRAFSPEGAERVVLARHPVLTGAFPRRSYHAVCDSRDDAAAFTAQLDALRSALLDTAMMRPLTVGGADVPDGPSYLAVVDGVVQAWRSGVKLSTPDMGRHVVQQRIVAPTLAKFNAVPLRGDGGAPAAGAGGGAAASEEKAGGGGGEPQGSTVGSGAGKDEYLPDLAAQDPRPRLLGELDAAARGLPAGLAQWARAEAEKAMEARWADIARRNEEVGKQVLWQEEEQERREPRRKMVGKSHCQNIFSGMETKVYNDVCTLFKKVTQHLRNGTVVEGPWQAVGEEVGNVLSQSRETGPSFVGKLFIGAVSVAAGFVTGGAATAAMGAAFVGGAIPTAVAAGATAVGALSGAGGGGTAAGGAAAGGAHAGARRKHVTRFDTDDSDGDDDATDGDGGGGGNGASGAGGAGNGWVWPGADHGGGAAAAGGGGPSKLEALRSKLPGVALTPAQAVAELTSHPISRNIFIIDEPAPEFAASGSPSDGGGGDDDGKYAGIGSGAVMVDVRVNGQQRIFLHVPGVPGGTAKTVRQDRLFEMHHATAFDATAPTAGPNSVPAAAARVQTGAHSKVAVKAAVLVAGHVMFVGGSALGVTENFADAGKNDEVTFAVLKGTSGAPLPARVVQAVQKAARKKKMAKK